MPYLIDPKVQQPTGENTTMNNSNIQSLKIPAKSNLLQDILREGAKMKYSRFISGSKQDAA